MGSIGLVKHLHAEAVNAWDAAHAGGWELDVFANALWLSSQSCRILGFGLKEFTGRPDMLFSAIHRDDRYALHAALEKGMRDRVSLTVVQRILQLGGRTRLVQMQVAPLVRDRSIVFCGTMRDITERSDADPKTAPPAAGQTDALDNLSEGCYMLDRAWRFTYLNKEAERILQRPRAELLGKVLWKEFAGIMGTAVDREFHRSMREKRQAVFGAYYPHLEKWTKMRVVPAADGLAVYLQDISESGAT